VRVLKNGAMVDGVGWLHATTANKTSKPLGTIRFTRTPPRTG
jgi:hypothetical protein